MDKLKEKLWEELEEIDRKPEIGPGDLELAHKLTDTIKNIDKICMLEEGEGYSSANHGQHYVRGHYSRDGMRGDRRDGMRGDRRDGMRGDRRDGYSSRRDSRGGYSRDDGRSAMMEHLEAALDSANDQDRETIKRFMRQLENA